MGQWVLPGDIKKEIKTPSQLNNSVNYMMKVTSESQIEYLFTFFYHLVITLHFYLKSKYMYINKIMCNHYFMCCAALTHNCNEIMRYSTKANLEANSPLVQGSLFESKNNRSPNYFSGLLKPFLCPWIRGTVFIWMLLFSCGYETEWQRGSLSTGFI